MTRSVYIRLASLALSAIAAGCGESTGDAVSAPTAPSSVPSPPPSGSPAVTCPYIVDPTNIEEGNDEGGAEINLTTFAGCPWTATPSESWIEVRPASGAGPGNIRLEVTRNTGSARHAFVTVAGQRVNVTQRGR
jgi:hypothetical protein